jgi:hypothetical protein
VVSIAALARGANAATARTIAQLSATSESNFLMLVPPFLNTGPARAMFNVHRPGTG